MAEILNLPPFSARIAKLPLDHRGYPVPWFVQWIDGKPQFPIIDGRKRERAVTEKLCWICGEQLGAFLAFVVGPMCGINRVSAEPPSHLECAEFAVRGCPFLNPNMKRIENDYTKLGQNPGGVMIKRNPGVTLLWVTKSYQPFSDGRGGWLIKIGEPRSIQLWKEGRKATQAELSEAIESGLPQLEAQAKDADDLEELSEMKENFFRLARAAG